MKHYSKKPDGLTKPLTEKVSIGWRHTIVETDAGREIVYTLDDNGEPIPTVYEVKLVLTTSELLAAATEFTKRDLQDINKRFAEGDQTTIVEMAGAIFGDDLILAVANDPTVSDDDFADLWTDLLAARGFGEVAPVPEGAEDIPFGSDASSESSTA